MKVYIYTRFSPRPDAQTSDSCEKQLDRCINFCKSKGWTDWDAFQSSYCDESVSGVDIERLALNALISRLVKKKERCAVVIDSPDRLARDTMVGLVLKERITRAGGVIAYADGSPSGSSPEDTFIITMMLALATLERDRVSYRTSRGLKKRQANGEFFGKPPIGYQRPGGKGTKLVPCMSERESVNAARTLFKQGWSSSAVARKIQDTICDFRGGNWKPKTVRKMARKNHDWEKEGDDEK